MASSRLRFVCTRFLPFRTVGRRLLFHKSLPKTFTKQLEDSHLRNYRSLFTTSSLRATIPFLLSDIGEGISEVQLKEWYVKVGDRVSQFDQLCEVQSDKAAVVITSRYDGVIRKLYHEVDDIAKQGLPLVDIEVEGDIEQKDASETPPSEQPVHQSDSETQQSEPVVQKGGKPLATPAVRKIALENNVDLASVAGTGKDGRILKEDILSHIAGVQKEIPVTPLVPPGPPPLQYEATPPQGGLIPERVILLKDQEEPIKGFKRTMVKTMADSGQIPQFGYCDEINMNALVQLRTSLKEVLAARGVQFSYMPFVIKAVSLALQYYPVLNSHTDSTCSKLIYKASHNVGVAMDTPDGLIVPNIKDVQSKSISEVAVELNRLMQKGQAGQLGMSDLTGGTFSLSNIGAIGGTYTRPMLLPPEVAIGALGKIQKLPRYSPSGDVVPTSVMHVSWSADHRVIDGATVARFSNLWKSYMENPASLTLELK